MRCNTPLMNSWHSFSPNGRWLVFSSKSRSPYTQMFLTHLDAAGNDSPAVLIENSTAANRAVNIPEFVNIPPDGLLKIDAPVTEYYRLVDVATGFQKKGQYDAAVREWRKALELGPTEAPVHHNLALALAETGHVDEAIAHYTKAVELSPDYAEAHNNLGELLAGRNRLQEAVVHFEKALAVRPDFGGAHGNLGVALSQLERVDQAIPHLQKAVQYKPDDPSLRMNLGIALAVSGKPADAIPQLEQAVKLSAGRDLMMLDLLGQLYAGAGRFAEATQAARRALAIATRQNNAKAMEALKARIAEYASHQ
jgi:Flp pilus assembly protein TadD